MDTAPLGAAKEKAVPSDRSGAAVDLKVLFAEARKLTRQKLSAAEPLLRRVIELRPDHPQAHYELGKLMLALRRGAEAAEAFERHLEIDPRSARAMTLLAKYKFGVKEFERALELVAAARVLDPAFEMAATQQLGMLVRLDRTREALEAARRLAADRPDSATAQVAAGEALVELGQVAEAVGCFERAVAVDPGNTNALRELGVSRSLARRESAPAVKPKLAIWPRQNKAFENIEKLYRDYVLPGSKPDAPVVAKTSRVVSMGSCFAGHIAQRLRDRGVDIYYRPIGEEINNTYANRYLADWIVNGPVSEQARELEQIYGAEERESFRTRLDGADLVILTLGVAPCFFERGTGRFVFPHGAAIEAKRLPELCDFRTTTVAENVANLKAMMADLRKLSPGIRFVLTVSPVPLAATYERPSAVVADAVSKSVMRLAADEILKAGDPNVYYWPSFEMVRWIGSYMPPGVPPVFGVEDGNTRHVSVWLVDMIMKLFIEYFGTDEVRAAGPGSVASGSDTGPVEAAAE